MFELYHPESKKLLSRYYDLKEFKEYVLRDYNILIDQWKVKPEFLNKIIWGNDEK